MFSKPHVSKPGDSESLLEAVLESTADGLLVVDRDGQIARFNRRFADLWCIAADILQGDEGAGRVFASMLERLKHPESFLDRVRVLHGEPEAEGEDVLELLDGRTLELYSRPQCTRNEVVGRIWSFRDVTRRVEAERKAHAAERQLEQREKERTTAALRERAAVSRETSSLIAFARAAHELKSPLSYIVANLELAIEMIGEGRTLEGNAGTTLRELLRDALDGATGARRTVQDLPAIFQVEPQAMAAGAAQAPKSEREQAGALPPSRRTLVIDDDETVARAVGRILRAHAPTLVTSGSDGLALIERGERYEVILCDLMMPEMSGMDVYRRLEEIAPDQARKVIFITGGAFTPESQEFLSRVENVHVEKPLDARRLREVVGSFLEPRVSNRAPPM